MKERTGKIRKENWIVYEVKRPGWLTLKEIVDKAMGRTPAKHKTVRLLLTNKTVYRDN